MNENLPLFLFVISSVSAGAGFFCGHIITLYKLKSQLVSRYDCEKSTAESNKKIECLARQVSDLSKDIKDLSRSFSELIGKIEGADIFRK